MATHSFYATSCTNSTYNGLLNGGEKSWSRSASTSVNTYDLGYFVYNMSSIRSTIPSVATIHSVEFHMDIKQSRSATALYHTQLKSQLYVGSTAKSSENTSPDVGNSYETKAYGNTVTITSSELYSQDLRVRYQMTYKGTLGATQYAKNLLCKILWDPINTTALSINKTSTTLNKGANETLTVTRTPSSVSYPTISWSSSNTSVATVNSSGVVTAVGNGTCTITATTTDGTNISKTCSVTVRTPVTGVTVSPTSLTLNVGGTYTLAKTISPSGASNQNVVWSTNNTSVATVDSSGKVTAVSRGTCTITCTSSENSSYKGTCAVTVNQQATGIAIVPSSKEILLGTPKTNIFDYGKWVTNGIYSDGSYVSFNNYGLTLTSTRNDTFTSGYHMGATATDSQKEIVDKYGFSVIAGKTYTLAVDVNQNSANNSEIFIFWYNSSKGYISHNAASITGSGTLIYSKQAPSGATYACIRLDNNVSGYTNLYTNIRVQEEDSDTSIVGQCNVYAKVLPYNVSNENYTITSSDSSIASVSGNGTIIANKAGTVTITATSADGGHKATCTITIKATDTSKIANGSIFIKNMILGSTNIKSAYIGSVKIFEK